MNYLDLFSGIGGFALGAYWAGLRFDNHYFSEVEPYAVDLYQRRFPGSIGLGDITKIDTGSLPLGEWIISGGFPCQPHSLAGSRKADSDERDLWPQCRRMLRELRPRYAVFENVPGLFTSDNGRFFNRVLSDISASGYDCEWQIISAAEIGAPHKRDRVWIVAYPNSQQHKSTPHAQRRTPVQKLPANTTCLNCDAWRTESAGQFRTTGIAYGGGNVADTNSIDWRAGTGRNNRPETDNNSWWATEPDVGRVANGIPARVDRLKGLGNSIVPQIAEMIFRQRAFDEWRE